MFIIVIICVLSPYTLAPLIEHPGSSVPSIHKNCIDWIFHHGFQNNPFYNKQWALIRGMQFNHFISLWAAGYAYGLSRDENYFDLSIHLPWVFCNRHVIESAVYSYMPLREAEFTCEGWINFYGHEHRNDSSQRLYWATHRDISMDPHISIWAAGYFRYITSDETRNEVTSAQYCRGMGHMVVDLPDQYPFMKLDGTKMSCQNPRLFYSKYLDDLRLKENCVKNRLPFMTLNDSYLTCEEWITLYGYTDNIKLNSEKTMQQHTDFDDFLAFCVRDYVIHLRNIIKYLNGIRRTPEDFCKSKNKPSTVKLNFYCVG